MVTARSASDTAAADTSKGGPYEPTLPPIELESIAPAPLELPPLAPLEDIALAEIPFAPVVIAPLTEEERP
jgi:hypothetical protein